LPLRKKGITIRFKPRKPKFAEIRPNVLMNEAIRSSEMRLIDQFGEQLGVFSRQSALELAEREGKDLVMITEKAVPPVVKLIEFSKFKYQLQQKKQEEKKGSKGNVIKELRLTPFMASGDLEARINRIREFLEENNKVRLQMKFKGREITKQEFGMSVFTRIFTAIEDVGRVEIAPKLLGKVMSAQITPTGKKKAVVETAAPAATE
jgi:translation initiation factor IF-3